MTSTGNGFDARDIEIAQDLGEIKAMLKVVVDDIAETRDKLRNYCAQNELSHKSIWRRLDLHHRLIFIGVGILTVAGVLAGWAIRILHANP